MIKFYNTPVDEQETTIGMDYYKKEISIYTSRKSVYERLIKKIGEPNRLDFYKGKICGCIWRISFEDKKRANAIFSKTIILGHC